LDFSALNGFRMWDPYQNRLNLKINYQGISCYNATSGTVFNVDTTASPWNTTMQGAVLTNGANMNFYSTTNTASTNTISITGQTGDIRSLGRVTAANLSITNNGAVTFYGTNGALLTTLTFTNGGIQAFGKTMFATNWPSGSYTNLGIGGRTNIFQYSSGNVTNIIIL